MIKPKIFLSLFIVFSSLSTYADEFKIFSEEDEKGRIYFYAKNPELCPYQCTMRIENIDDVKIDVALPFYFVIEPNIEKKFLFMATPVNPDKKNIIFTYRYFIGNPETAKHQENYIYTIPYENGKTHLLSQGYNGKFSHKGENALDFKMKKGSAVCAARAGLVIQVKEDSEKGGGNAKYSDDANFVRILHNDGTIASYLHLNPFGSLVEVGDKVNDGQVIAYSGNTGWSTMAHLHFVVNKPINMGYESVATKFMLKPHKVKNLKAWWFYKSYHSSLND